MNRGSPAPKAESPIFFVKLSAFYSKDSLCSGISLNLFKKKRSIGLIFLWKSVLIFENESRFSREPLGYPLSDFWEPRGVCSISALWVLLSLRLVAEGNSDVKFFI